MSSDVTPSAPASPAPWVPLSFAFSAGKASQPNGLVRSHACGNSGCERIERFCPHCGQENADPVMPLGEIVREVFHELTSTDAKLWKTLRVLLTCPGLLTTDFLLC